MADEDARRLGITTQLPRHMMTANHFADLGGNGFRRAIYTLIFIYVASSSEGGGGQIQLSASHQAEELNKIQPGIYKSKPKKFFLGETNDYHHLQLVLILGNILS